MWLFCLEDACVALSGLFLKGHFPHYDNVQTTSRGSAKTSAFFTRRICNNLRGWDPVFLVQGPNSGIFPEIACRRSKTSSGTTADSVSCSRATQTCTSASLGSSGARNAFETLRPWSQKTTCSFSCPFRGRVPGNRDPNCIASEFKENLGKLQKFVMCLRYCLPGTEPKNPEPPSQKKNKREECKIPQPGSGPQTTKKYEKCQTFGPFSEFIRIFGARCWVGDFVFSFLVIFWGFRVSRVFLGSVPGKQHRNHMIKDELAPVLVQRANFL